MGQRVVVAVVGELRGFVAAVGGSPVCVILNSLGDSPEIIVEVLGLDSSGVGRSIQPTGGGKDVVGGYQDSIGSARRRTGPRVGRTAVGADVCCFDEPIRKIIVTRDVGTPRRKMGA
jgi:hypothetical protein